MADEIVRTPEELAEVENAWAEAFDDGNPHASWMLDLLQWLTDPDASKPIP